MQNYKPLSEQKIDAMKKNIDKYFGKNFIRLNLSATTTLTLLVKKPEDELRFYIDYGTFNAITIKNRYLILLINEIFSKLSNIKQFKK